MRTVRSWLFLLLGVFLFAYLLLLVWTTLPDTPRTVEEILRAVTTFLEGSSHVGAATNLVLVILIALLLAAGRLLSALTRTLLRLLRWLLSGGADELQVPQDPVSYKWAWVVVFTYVMSRATLR